MEQFGRNFSPEETGRLEESSSESTIPEKGFFGRLEDRAKGLVRTAMVMSTLSAAPVFSEEPAQADKAKQTSQEQGEKLDESKVTESSTWARDIMKNAQDDLSKIKTADDAEILVRTYLGQLVTEYYFPTKGKVTKGSGGIDMREYSDEDSKLLLSVAKNMKQLLQDLNTKFSIATYKERQEQLDDMVTKITIQSSYEHKQQMKMFDSLMKK